MSIQFCQANELKRSVWTWVSSVAVSSGTGMPERESSSTADTSSKTLDIPSEDPSMELHSKRKRKSASRAGNAWSELIPRCIIKQ